jgi:hypothetical protein
VHLDHDLNKQYDFERNGYFSFDLTLAKIVNGGIEEKVFLPNVRSGELYVLNLNPGRYSLVKGRFVINGWIERYDPNNITFEIKEGMLAYAGDIYIITKTFNNKSFGSLSSGATVHYNYIMKQYLRYNEETLLRFKEMYPELAKSRTVTLLSN